MKELFFKKTLAAVDSPEGVINVITKVGGFLYTLVIALGVLFILVGALNILTAGGDEKKFSKGKTQILYAAVAVAVAVLATGIVKIVRDLVGG